LGVGLEEIRERMSQVTLPGMRLERTDIDGVVFINDSYNANPDSFEGAIKTCFEYPASGRRIVVAGDMMELGAASPDLHRKIGQEISTRGIDLLVTVGSQARCIARGAIASGMDSARVLQADDTIGGAHMLRSITRPDDIVLIKGSRGMRMEEILGCYTTFCTP